MEKLVQIAQKMGFMLEWTLHWDQDINESRVEIEFLRLKMEFIVRVLRCKIAMLNCSVKTQFLNGFHIEFLNQNTFNFAPSMSPGIWNYHFLLCCVMEFQIHLNSFKCITTYTNIWHIRLFWWFVRELFTANAHILWWLTSESIPEWSCLPALERLLSLWFKLIKYPMPPIECSIVLIRSGKPCLYHQKSIYLFFTHNWFVCLSSKER